MPVPAELKPFSPGPADTGTAAADLPDPATGEHHAVNAGKRVSRETGGPAGPEPTRYGDWEHAGRCIDF